MSRHHFLVIGLSVALVGCTQSSPNDGEHRQPNPAPAAVTQSPVVGNSSLQGSNPLPAPEKPQSQGEEPAGISAEKADSSPTESPIVPTLLEAEPLLLADDGDEDDRAPKADNSRCFVCHLNYEQEEIAVVHAREGYGCAYCHGPSDAHIADESWASGGNGTPPDIMYRPHEVIPACLKCHDLSASDPACHCEFPKLPEKKSCTDCHGSHRLKSRKCHWK